MTPIDLPYAEMYKVYRAREDAFRRMANENLDWCQAPRTRVAVVLSRLVFWLVERLPRHWADWLHGRDPYHSAVAGFVGATLCRLVGHRWSLLVPGSGSIGHTMVCDACNAMPNTEDLDWFGEGRDRRDFAAVAAELAGVWDVARAMHRYPPKAA